MQTSENRGDWFGVELLVIGVFFIYPDTSMVELMGPGVGWLSGRGTPTLTVRGIEVDTLMGAIIVVCYCKSSFRLTQ